MHPPVATTEDFLPGCVSLCEIWVIGSFVTYI